MRSFGWKAVEREPLEVIPQVRSEIRDAFGRARAEWTISNLSERWPNCGSYKLRRQLLWWVAAMVFVKMEVLSVLVLIPKLHLMGETMPDVNVGFFVVQPVLVQPVEAIWVGACLVSALVRLEVVDEMGARGRQVPSTASDAVTDWGLTWTLTAISCWLSIHQGS